VKKLFFTGGGGAGNEALWRYFNNDYDVHFGDADIQSIDLAIPQTNRHKIPYANSLDFIENLSELCKKLSIDLLIPGVDEELLLLAESAGEFLPTKLLLPNANYIETMLNKYEMVKCLDKIHLPVPKTELLSNNSFGIDTPCILKPIYGRGSRDVYVIEKNKDINDFKKKYGKNSKEYIVQEKIVGTEYTVQMMCDEKKQLHAIIPVKILLKRGVTLRGVTDNQKNIIKACKAIHNALPTKGTYNIQLILTSNKKVLPFEINPRISTTFCLALHAISMDPVDLYLSEQKQNSQLSIVKSGIQIRRHWRNYIFSSN